MTRLLSSLRALLSATALFPAGCIAAAADDSTPATEPRYAVHDQRVERAASRETAYERYRLEVQLERESLAAASGGDFALRAVLFDPKATACGVNADAIFANGFE